jgi:hypothetical protein
MTRIQERHALTITNNLIVTDCAACGVVFAITEEFRASRQKDGKTFYCPNGHTLHYSESEAERLRKKLERTEQQLAWQRDMREGANRRADAAERKLRATKGVVTKMKKRAAAGICPCCNRHFVQLERHMANKHPDYAVEDPS